MPRTLIKTDTAGWFEDPTAEDGKKVRKTADDKIVTRAEYDAMLEGDSNGGQTATESLKAKIQEAVKDAPAVTTLTSGKTVIGQTIVRKCAWVDPENRTPKQEKLFSSNFEGVPAEKTFDAVTKAAGDKRSALPDGRERTIKPQDSFQARFHPENQKKWRAELRRIKNRQRREAAKAAAKS